MGAGVAPTMKDFCDEEPARSALLSFLRGDSTLATRATGATRRDFGDLATLSSSSLSRVRSTTANASVEVLFAMFAVQVLEKGTNTLNVRFKTCRKWHLYLMLAGRSHQAANTTEA